MSRQKWVLLFAVFSCGHAAHLFAQSAGYPSGPIRLIVPYAPGGVADLMSRIIGQRLGPFYNQQIVIDNRPGSGGHIGADSPGARAALDRARDYRSRRASGSRDQAQCG
jgi:tripartite-type tricarboxylate transporter receptor subunit TctC